MNVRGRKQGDWEAGDLILRASSAAIAAGRAALRYHGTDLHAEKKSDNTPVSEADRAAHAEIIRHLGADGADLPILSEEGEGVPYSLRRRWLAFWMVDPLDGTMEFLRQTGDFTVNIALMRDHIPDLGVIYVPMRDLLYVGSQSEGAFVLDHAHERGVEGAERARLPRPASARPVTITASSSHNTPRTDAFIGTIEQRYGEVRVARAGSAMKLCAVAEGTADFYPRFGPTMEWDTAAGDAILRAVGGRIVRAADGRRLAYNKRSLSNPDFVAVGSGRTIPAAARSV